MVENHDRRNARLNLESFTVLEIGRWHSSDRCRLRCWDGKRMLLIVHRGNHWWILIERGVPNARWPHLYHDRDRTDCGISFAWDRRGQRTASIGEVEGTHIGVGSLRQLANPG